jgi:hypothetical protein
MLFALQLQPFTVLRLTTGAARVNQDRLCGSPRQLAAASSVRTPFESVVPRVNLCKLLYLCWEDVSCCDVM